MACSGLQVTRLTSELGLLSSFLHQNLLKKKTNVTKTMKATTELTEADTSSTGKPLAVLFCASVPTKIKWGKKKRKEKKNRLHVMLPLLSEIMETHNLKKIGISQSNNASMLQ